MSPILIIYLAGMLVCWAGVGYEVWHFGIKSSLEIPRQPYVIEPHNIRAAFLIGLLAAPVWPGMLAAYLALHLIVALTEWVKGGNR